jgi:hypothetical protein
VSASDYRLIPARDAGKLLRPDAPLTAVGARQALRRAGIRELRGYRESDVLWLVRQRDFNAQRKERGQSIVKTQKPTNSTVVLYIAGKGLIGDITITIDGFHSKETANEICDLFATALRDKYAALVDVEKGV